ncbi:MAG: iron ABC transporter permease [Lentisphaerae bacterium]|nr:iron ABC transporter permease [Lentisphaerota bacterium]
MMHARRIPLWPFIVATPLVLATCVLFGPAGLILPDGGTELGRSILILRLQRVAAGFVVGAGLACAGTVLQAILRNPLAEPYVLGISGGAGLGAAGAILTGLAAWNVFMVPLSAFVASALALFAVYLLAAWGGRISVYGLILSGVIVSSVASSLLMFMVTVTPARGLHSVLWWMLGNLQVSDPALLEACALAIFPASGILWLMSRELNAMTLGHEAAHHLGVRCAVVVPLGLGLATLITGAAVGLSGMIGFVGLVVPHVTRTLTGPDHRRLIPASMLAGGVFLALSDAVARTVLAPRELPVGVITSLIGGPFFLALLQNRRRRGWVD